MPSAEWRRQLPHFDRRIIQDQARQICGPAHFSAHLPARASLARRRAAICIFCARRNSPHQTPAGRAEELEHEIAEGRHTFAARGAPTCARASTGP
jgi:hypothetical protein